MSKLIYCNVENLISGSGCYTAVAGWKNRDLQKEVASQMGGWVLTNYGQVIFRHKLWWNLLKYCCFVQIEFSGISFLEGEKIFTNGLCFS